MLIKFPETFRFGDSIITCVIPSRFRFKNDREFRYGFTDGVLDNFNYRTAHGIDIIVIV